MNRTELWGPDRLNPALAEEIQERVGAMRSELFTDEERETRAFMAAERARAMTPKIGDYLMPDGWNGDGENLQAGDAYVDSGYPGCQFRLMLRHDQRLSCAVNLTVTGRKTNRRGYWRVKIEFVGDCEPSTFAGGWIMIR